MAKETEFGKVCFRNFFFFQKSWAGTYANEEDLLENEMLSTWERKASCSNSSN